MSELEQAIRPLLEPMLHGEPRILDGDRQKLLATWAFKTAVMLEFTYPQERAIQLEDAGCLHRDQRPPESASIWIASYRGMNYNTFYRHDVMQPQAVVRRVGDSNEGEDAGRGHDEPLAPPVAYGVTFGIRHVAFQLFGTTEPHLRVAHDGVAAAAFERIWPVRVAFSWPPAIAIDDESLSHVLRMFENAQYARVVRPRS